MYPGSHALCFCQDPMKYASQQSCLIFSHRGASREAAENTPWAFDKSLDYGVDGIETDVQLSRDGIAVLWHDRFLDKIGKPHQRVDDLDFEQLVNLDLPDTFTRLQDDSRLIGLETFIKNYHHRALLLIEVKNREFDEGTGRHELKMQQCLDLAKHYSDPIKTATIMISSFNLESLVYAHRYSESWPLIYNSKKLVEPSQIENFCQIHSFIAGFCLPIENLNPEIVKAVQGCKKSLVTYTCNDDEQILKGLRLGVDILISDDPQRALALRG